MRAFLRLSVPAALILLAACGSDDASGLEPVGSDAPQEPSVEASRDGNAQTGATGTDGGTDSEPEPQGPPSVQFVGRFDTRDTAGPRCGWPGCRVVARFSGTSVSATLAEAVDDWMEGGPSEWDVAIDGAWQPKLVTTLGSKVYDLASNLPAGNHVVELYKRSEAQNGITQFRGFDFHGGTLLAPPARKARKIEIIGDSQPAAFGVEGVGQGGTCPGLQYAAKWQNFRRSFGAVIGTKVNAEVFGTVYSGKGLVRNIWRPDTETMPRIFARAEPINPESSWDFSQAIPNAVIVMIGGNDFAFGQPVDDGEPTVAQFTDAYDALVVTARTKYPSATIILSASPSADDRQPEGRNTRTNVIAGIRGVVARRQAAGDTNVLEFHPTVAPQSELTGCEGHGSPAFHERVANEYLPILHSSLGW